jgi:DNA-binding NtrC family response regulator
MHMPPLRERKEDIILLVAEFVYEACCRSRIPLKKISSSVEALFVDYFWQGKLRELKTAIKSAMMVSEGEYLTLSGIPMHLQQHAASHREEISVKAIQNLDEAREKGGRRSAEDST